MAGEEKDTPASATERSDDVTKLLRGIHILPPLQRKATLDRDELLDAVRLPPLRPEEPVASLRGALCEVSGFAHITNYRLVLIKDKTMKLTDSRPATIPSPYTGRDAVVSLPSSFHSLATGTQQTSNEVVLDDYGDLKTLLDEGLEESCCLRIVLERYGAASVKEHVQRVRALLQGNAPYMSNMFEGAKEDEEPVESETPDSNKENKESPETAKTKETLPKDPTEIDTTNLNDFFYQVCGDERPKAPGSALDALEELLEDEKPKKKGSKSKKGRGKDSSSTTAESTQSSKPDAADETKDTLTRISTLEDILHVKCSIRYSGFHPPPPRRKLMGDLAYFEVTMPDSSVVNVTACPTGFYVNRSVIANGSRKFDPSPATEPCFSHELLDCVIAASKSFRSAWEAALSAAKERSDLITSSNTEGAVQSLQRMAIRVDYGSSKDPMSGAHGLDSVIMRPTWVVPLPKTTNEDDWTHNSLHDYSTVRVEDDLSNTFGLDLRSGMPRDWNEELQVAREMPVTSLQERIERARTIHKTLSDFGEAALAGTKAIFEGHIAPMNPNEPIRSHVYLHNNIFFSRAVDSGVETFKMAQGDRAAKKSASRDAQCMGLLHRMDVSGLHTLATVLVDYLGTRFVCQSIVPGILQGEKTHSLMYGAVEATAPLSRDEETHQKLEALLGASLMCATRKVPTLPLTDERMAEIEKIKKESLFLLERPPVKDPETTGPTTTMCGPIEAKGIKGSDQRTYLLDLTRVTPRDANWISKSQGGTGNWEKAIESSSSNNGRGKSHVPEALDDDEWIMAVLRPELVTALAHKQMAKYLDAKRAKDSEETEKTEDGKKTTEDKSPKEGSTEGGNTENETARSKPADAGTGDEAKDGGRKDEKAATKSSRRTALTPEDEEHLKSLRYNVNVFLPNLRSLKDIDEESEKQLELDEQRVREAANHLWDALLPKITDDVRNGIGHQLPADGKSLAELLHQRGINCRYLGRLAMLAAEQESKDKSSNGKPTLLSRRTMPLYWLELLETEMVARAAKHVLDSYLMEGGGSGTAQPLQTIASFLCALISEGEESAGETETRLSKEASAGKDGVPDEDDFSSLSLVDAGGSGDALPDPVRGRKQVWEDIGSEVGRRFRYDLSLYNKGNSGGRALHMPLLRRFCQRYGIRLVARRYAVGGKCLCSGGSTEGGRLTSSFPISPLDIVEINPLMKHSGALSGEGFVPCSTGSPTSLPALHILLHDAKATYDAAHYSYGARALPQALELAHEAASLYQRVIDSPMHIHVARCLDLTAAILFDAQEPALAVANASRGLSLSVQLGGFDCEEALTGHSALSHILMNTGNTAQGVKHLKAAVYLMEMLAGPHYSELPNAYHKLAVIYHEAGNVESALRCYKQAASRHHSDRLAEGMIVKSMAVLLASMGQFKAAVDTEKRAYQIYSLLLGERHELTKNSQTTLESVTKLAVEQGSRQVAAEQKRKDELAAEAMASQMAEEADEEERRKKKGGKKKKKK